MHQERLGVGVQFDGGGEGHVEFGGEQGLGLGEREGGAVGEAAGQLGGALVGLPLLGQLADQPDPLGLGRPDGVPEHQEAGGVAEADDPGQQIGGAHVAAGEADPGEEEGEAGRGVGDAEVRRQGQHGPGPGGHPVDRGDDGEGALPQGADDLSGHPVEVEEPRGVHGQGGADDLVDVPAGAEAAPLPREDESADRAFPGELGEEVAQIGVGAEGERVEFLGAIECDGGHTVVPGQPQMAPAFGGAGRAGKRAHGGVPFSDRAGAGRARVAFRLRSYHSYVTAVTRSQYGVHETVVAKVPFAPADRPYGGTGAVRKVETRKSRLEHQVNPSSREKP